MVIRAEVLSTIVKGTNKRAKYQIYLSISERKYFQRQFKGTIKREINKINADLILVIRAEVFAFLHLVQFIIELNSQELEMNWR